MKNLFVSFICKDDIRGFACSNTCFAAPDKIKNQDDIIALEEYIEMTTGLRNVVVNNFRRME